MTVTISDGLLLAAAGVVLLVYLLGAALGAAVCLVFSADAPPRALFTPAPALAPLAPLPPLPPGGAPAVLMAVPAPAWQPPAFGIDHTAEFDTLMADIAAATESARAQLCAA